MKLLTKAGEALNAIKNAKGTPKVMMVSGVSIIVASGVFACIRTMKLEEKVDEIKYNVDQAKALKEDGEYLIGTNDDGEDEMAEYTPALYRKDITNAWVHGVWEIGKLYLPSIIGTGIGITLVAGSNKILDDRLTQTTLALTCMSESFQKYRRNVINDQGEEADQRYMVGLETKKNLEMKVIDPETGAIKTIKEKNVDVIMDAKNIASPYAVILSNTGWWTGDGNYNSQQIDAYLSWLNMNLRHKHYIYLYDIYKSFGVLENISDEAIAMSHQVGIMEGFGDGELRINPITPRLGSEDVFKDIFVVDFNCMGGDYIDGNYVPFNELVRRRAWLDREVGSIA